MFSSLNKGYNWSFSSFMLEIMTQEKKNIDWSVILNTPFIFPDFMTSDYLKKEMYFSDDLVKRKDEVKADLYDLMWRR